jgi:hypothetical protein
MKALVKQRSTVKQGLKKLQFGEPTKNSKNQKAMSIDQPVKEVITEYEFPVSQRLFYPNKQVKHYQA